jgi:coenzyme F420-reducing hydrogenase beta subunit
MMSWKDRYAGIKVGDIVEYYQYTNNIGDIIGGQPILPIGTKIIITKIHKEDDGIDDMYESVYLDNKIDTDVLVWASEVRKV